MARNSVKQLVLTRNARLLPKSRSCVRGLRSFSVKTQCYASSENNACRLYKNTAWSSIAFQRQKPYNLQFCQTASYSSDSNLRRTPLYDLNVQHGGKMVPFGGYEMPVQYSDLSLSESHLWTREKASLFDVSHMVQHNFTGPGAQALIEHMTPAGLDSLGPHQSSLSTLLHPGTGGIVDDSVITRLGPDSFYFVTNAGCREKDLAYLEKNVKEWNSANKDQVQWTVLEGQGLVALQGPLASQILARLVADKNEDNLDTLYFGTSKFIKLRLQTGQETSPLLVSRGGYTGEDGFEISIPGEETPAVVESLLSTAGQDELRLAGLGARDSLRLEAGMCLYGHDLDDSTTPVEAALGWVVAKDRRSTGGFNGDEVILQQLKPKKEGGGVSRRRVGLIVEGAPAREGAGIFDSDGNSVGTVTSGCPSPTLKKNIAMGYVKSGLHTSGTELLVEVRKKQRKAVVTKMPFVPSKYWKG